VKFRVVRDNEFGGQRGKLNPMRGTPMADRLTQSGEFPTAWTVEIADLEDLRNLCNEIAQIEESSGPPTVSLDFLPHYEETPADCEGMIFICF